MTKTRVMVGALCIAALIVPAAGQGRVAQAVSGTSITAWVHQGTTAEVAAAQVMVAAFNKANAGKIHATLKVIPNTSDYSYQTKVSAAVAAHQTPDVVDMDGPYVAAYAHLGILTPIDPWMSTINAPDLVKSIVEQGTFNGHLYALGAFSSSMFMLFNKDLLAKAGVTAPTTLQGAWNWTTFVNALKAIHTKEPNVIPLDLCYYCLPGEWGTYAFTPFVWSNGGDLISPDGKTAGGFANGPKTVQAMQLIQNLVKDGLNPLSESTDEFGAGKVAFQYNGPWSLANLTKYPGLHYGAMPIPYVKAKVSPSGSWCWGVSAQSSNKAAAFALVKWLTDTTTGVVPIVTANSNPPARVSAYAKFSQYSTDPILKLIKQQLTTDSRARPVTPYYPELTNAFGTAVKNIMNGGAVKAQLDQVVQAYDQAISNGQ